MEERNKGWDEGICGHVGASEQGSVWGRLEAAVRLRGEKKRGPWEGLACWGELGATAALSAKGQV